MATLSTAVPTTPAVAPVKKTVVRRRPATKAAPVVVEAPAPVVVEAPAPVVVETPTPDPVNIVSTNDEELDIGTEPLESSTPPAKKRTAKGANKERLFQEFEKLYESLDKILVENNLKGVLKDLKSVRDMTYRLLKLKTVERQKRETNNSGFMKPVRISPELETFLKKNDLYQPEQTRAYLTTVLCSYIKTKNLQNPADRRIIFPDADMKALFSITDADTEPLTYYSLQKRIQAHIFKN